MTGTIALVLIGLVAATALASSLQKWMIFPRGGTVYRTPAAAGMAYEDVWLEVNGRKTHAWYIPAPESKGALLFSHGNAGTIADRLESIPVFHRLHLDVVLYDYGGYGNSTGSPSEKRCYADARAMWRYLTEQRGLPPERVVLFGRSLGGGIAAQLATEVTPGAVILESTFLSTVRIGREMLPFLPVGLIVRHRFDNEEKVARISAPLLVVHSAEDDLIPFHHGKTLFERARQPKEFLELRGGHNDGFIVSAPTYEQGLRDFVQPLLP